MNQMIRSAFALGFALLLSGLLPASAQTPSAPAQEPPVFRVEVDLVQLAVAVTDKGRYIRGLRPGDFRIYEDGIPQKLAIFSEAGAAPERVSTDVGTVSRSSLPASLAGSNIFVLVDTSNMMYRGFVHAQDAIADFIRSLDGQDSVAVYGFSRNLLRACPLTSDRRHALQGLRQLVAGDDTSLYNGLLLTLQDAAKVPGRKVVVVFSNGPDNGSMVSPEAVREYAENEGIPIYMISTQDLTKDDISSTVFERLALRTGGKTYFARTWQKQAEAFASIREDLAHLYVLSYYPSGNDNAGWRSITVELVGEGNRKYRIRTRSGYRPKIRTASMPVSGAVITSSASLDQE